MKDEQSDKCGTISSRLHKQEINYFGNVSLSVLNEESRV